MKVAISYGTSLDDSDYLSFNIKNIELYKFLNDLGIKIKKENDSEIEYEVGKHIFHDVFWEWTILKVDDLILIISFKQGIKRIAKGHHSIKKII